jgi:hypothetical protein
VTPTIVRAALTADRGPTAAAAAQNLRCDRGNRFLASCVTWSSLPNRTACTLALPRAVCVAAPKRVGWRPLDGYVRVDAA